MESLKTEIKRVNGYLKEFVTFFDASGKPISQVVNPLMVELKPRDVLQIFVGALLIASPLCFTEEVWNLSVDLKQFNVILLSGFSVITVTMFIYLNFYRFRLKGNVIEFVKRVAATYLITLFSVALILLLIDKLPFLDHPEVALRRVLIIGFPSVFAATISDYMK
ncbi:MAG: DUF2391 family protein [Bdellovibrionaceae bacterium]|nr:DUF2391 family protein [Bdellovibrionales bacterium]MCB9084362.1 DUF2391 family protein [Pseudobdellovibrionaceae bacterium]